MDKPNETLEFQDNKKPKAVFKTAKAKKAKTNKIAPSDRTAELERKIALLKAMDHEKELNEAKEEENVKQDVSATETFEKNNTNTTETFINEDVNIVKETIKKENVKVDKSVKTKNDTKNQSKNEAIGEDKNKNDDNSMEKQSAVTGNIPEYEIKNNTSEKSKAKKAVKKEEASNLKQKLETTTSNKDNKHEHVQDSIIENTKEESKTEHKEEKNKKVSNTKENKQTEKTTNKSTNKEGKYPPLVFGLDIGTRTLVGTLGYKEGSQFNVVAQCIKEHETRAMIDGQIHDIPLVAESIIAVKKSLEKQTGLKLTDVCIAAAGRVLKTCEISVEQVLEEEMVIDEEQVYSLDLMGVEKGHLQVNEGATDGIKFFCVGYTVTRYYLNGFVIGNLLGQKATKVGADVLATFLPEEVIDGLYTAVNLAGLEVANLTLEPIAAINIAIPEQYRLLNMALVDVGAGTSDISVTRDGCIIAYGMIPVAGDEITEVIAKHYLVDFITADVIKSSIDKNKTIEYADIMGLKQKVTPKQVLAVIQDVLKKMADDIGSKIIEINGEKPVNAVFVVGGGGKVPGFTSLLAKRLNIAEERVALRGQEVLTSINMLQKNLRKDPAIVTPIGICLNYYEQKNNFIFVYVNDERVKLYNNTKLNIVDATMAVGFPYEKIFPRRGAELEFTVNGKTRIIRGQVGEAAIITLNGVPTSFNASIEQNDRIEIKESTEGAAATMDIIGIPEYNSSLVFNINGQKITCPAYAEVNGRVESAYYTVKSGDEIHILEYYTVEKLLQFMDINTRCEIFVNHEPATEDTKIYENFTVDWNLVIEEYFPVNVNKSEYDLLTEVYDSREEKFTPEEKAKMEEEEQQQQLASRNKIGVLVNKTPIILMGKDEYTFVDIFDFYNFDLNSVQGNHLRHFINNEPCTFVSPVREGDLIDVYWED